MAVREILTAEHLVLRQKAKKVKRVDASTQKLIDDMFDSMHDAHGLGLAAPQIGVGLRVLIVEMPPEEKEPHSDKPFAPSAILRQAQDNGSGQAFVQGKPRGTSTSGEQIVLINPELVKSDGEQFGEEGCLSVPGYVGMVRRAEKVTVKGLNRKGKEIRVKGEGLLARALQHEIDHLDGILFTERLEKPEDLYRVTEDNQRVPVFQRGGL